jgi:hypothetical protein
MATQPSSDEKMHYDSLITLFKYILGWLLGLASLVVAVAAFFISSNIKDIKKDIQEDVAKLKPDIEKIGKDADKTLADTKESSKLSLEYTKTLSEMQIKLLALETSGAAKLEVRNKVEEAFKNNSVQFMIDQTARKEVNGKLKEVVKEETAKTQEVFNYLSQIQIAFEQVGKGSKYHLNFLDSLSNVAENDLIKSFAKTLVIQKGIDYEQSIFSPTYYTENANSFYQPESSLVVGGFLDTSRVKLVSSLNIEFSEKLTDDEILRILVPIMQKENNLNQLTVMYWHLRKLSKTAFKTFDSEPVYKWYKVRFGKVLKIN